MTNRGSQASAIDAPAESPPGASIQDPGAATPMIRQYLETKARFPDAVLFFRLGDFYEMFFEDAIRAAELLQITLTSRAKGTDRVPMCGVPYHSARRYIAKLIGHGLKVAICDQVGADPSGKSATLFHREVVRVVTPGTVLDDEVLEPTENNFLAAVLPSGRTEELGACLLEASTGEFIALHCACVEELADELSRAQARELVLPEGAKGSAFLAALLARLERPPPLAFAPEAGFEPARAEAFLKAHFQVASLDGFGVSAHPLAIGAAGAALRYLKDTQRTDARHVDRLSLASKDPQGGPLVIDEASRANLELLRTLKDGARRGSLVGVLDRTCTPMGARKLARWLIAPLRSLPEINARQDAVQELFEQGVARAELSGLLRGIADLERLGARLSLGVGGPRELRALANSLVKLPALAAFLSSLQSALLNALAGPVAAPASLGALLDRAVLDEPSATLQEGGLFKEGFDSELDGLIQETTQGKQYLLDLESRERQRTGISSLKVRFNRVFGYYLEVTRANLALVPPDYIRRQTTVGAERFVTPELKEHEEKVLTAQERRQAIEGRLFEQLRSQVVAAASLLRAAADAVATCDVLGCFSTCAAEFGYVRPTVDESQVLDLEEGRHPVIERVLPAGSFVPNDLHLDGERDQIVVITGPNMAGKSTVMRQVALITLLAQAGSFVPAKRARVGLCDRIFTRVGAADNLARGQSTFMVEMSETSHILHHATSKSLVVLDEIGRGTSTFDGLSIAWAVAEYLHDEVGARTLFATHYHELTDLPRDKPRVRNLQVAVREQQGKVTFLRKLVEGGASRSYGIEVARLAGLPPEVVGRSREILANLEKGELDEAGLPRLTHAPRASTAQLGLFAREPQAPYAPKEAQVLEEVRQVQVDGITPLQALNLLAGWKMRLGKP